MTNIVVDIETPNNTPDSAILSIGAAALSKDGAVVATFYTPVSLESCLRHGMTMGASTIAWWMEQSEEARLVWKEAQSDDAPVLAGALTLFSNWVRTQCTESRFVKLWGNGSDFDNVILSNAYALVGVPEPQRPWRFFGNSCFRQLKGDWKAYVPEPEFVGVKHNAKDDAIHEAVWLARILQVKAAVINAGLAAGVITKQEYPRG